MSTEVPAPPPGPGVRAPFAAPPTERDRKRMWIGLGAGAAALLVCCVGGVLGFAGLVVAQNRAIPREAVSVVDQYLRGLRDRNYPDAYSELCGRVRGQESLTEFTARHEQEAGIDSWTIDQPRTVGTTVLVPVSLELTGGPQQRTYTLVQDSQAGGLRICGGE